MISARTSYFLQSAVRVFTTPTCGYCGSRDNSAIDRKHLVTTLRKCRECNFQFRHPADRADFNSKFYQDDYTQAGLTTDMPPPEELERLKAQNFAGSAKNYQAQIATIRHLTAGKMPLRIVDYGASWGYTSFQFAAAGFDVQSFEISTPRASYGNDQLGLHIQTDERELQPGNDVFFSSHVIEHHPDVRAMIALARRLLTPDGLFIAYSPNGSAALRDANPWLFSKCWGLLHPNCLSADFYQHVFAEHPYLIASRPYGEELFRGWDPRTQRTTSLDGTELLVIARPNQRL
jgi:hypothetical protein